MKLYLNDKERSLTFLKLLEVMLNGALDSTNLNLDTESLIYNTNGISDPVEDFLTYYVEDSKSNFDKPTLEWIKNALYAAKGAPSVLDVLQDALGTKIEYEYEFPVLNIIKFENLSLSNLILFMTKFQSLLYYLMFFTELSIAIEHLTLKLIGDLTQNNQLYIKGFTIKLPEVINNEF